MTLSLDPSSRSIYFPGSPLIHALAQVRFSPILAMGDHIREIQDALRVKGFPIYELREVPVLRFDPNSNPSIDNQPRWDFIGAERKLAIFLSTNFTVVHTTRFRVFDELSDLLSMALEIIHRAARIGLIEQLGLRYVNLVRPAQGKKISDYLRTGLSGLCIPGLISATHRYEMVAQSGDGRVAVRCFQNYSGEYLPPDLANENLDHKVTVTDDEYICLLDLDHSAEPGVAFELADLLDSLGRMHDHLDLVFRAAVTQDALEAWRKEEQ